MKVVISSIETGDVRFLEMNLNAQINQVPDERVQKLLKDILDVAFGIYIDYVRVVLGEKYLKVSVDGRFSQLTTIALEKLMRLGSLVIWYDGTFSLVTEFKGEKQ